MSTATEAPSIAEIRAQFPALQEDFIYLENAGGSQMPQVVIDEIAHFLAHDNVQLGGLYPASVRAGKVVTDAQRFLRQLFNGEDLGYVVVGPSATALVFVLASCLRKTLSPGDEVIVSLANHESNIGPWERLQADGITVKWWGVDPKTGLSSLDDLSQLLTSKTKIVAFPLTCNIIGDRTDPKAVSELAHSVGALSICDAVAAASHEAMDVRTWDVDFCFLSNYKVYGPHCAAMWGKADLWDSLDGPNHRFLPRNESSPFTLGSLPYELLAGVNALGKYLGFLAQSDEIDRPTIERAFGVMGQMESPLSSRLVSYLSQKPSVRLLGPTEGQERHPTVSFVHDTIPSDVIQAEVQKRPIGIKSGNMYAWRFCQAIGIDPTPGVVRVSAVHYSTPDEIERLIDAFEQVL